MLSKLNKNIGCFLQKILKQENEWQMLNLFLASGSFMASETELLLEPIRNRKEDGMESKWWEMRWQGFGMEDGMKNGLMGSSAEDRRGSWFRFGFGWMKVRKWQNYEMAMGWKMVMEWWEDGYDASAEGVELKWWWYEMEKDRASARRTMAEWFETELRKNEFGEEILNELNRLFLPPFIGLRGRWRWFFWCNRLHVAASDRWCSWFGCNLPPTDSCTEASWRR